MLIVVLIGAISMKVSDWREHRTPEWREARFREFLHKELPSTCQVLGEHELSEFGCRWCNDIEPFIACLSESSNYYYLDPEGLKKAVAYNDPRIVGFNFVHWRWPSIRAGEVGIVWIDRSAKPDALRFAAELPATSLTIEEAIQYASVHGKEAKEQEAALQRRDRAVHAQRGAARRPTPGRRREAHAEKVNALRAATEGYR